MVNVQQQLINPQLGRTDYGVVTEATRLGLQEVLQAKKEKQARIRASLAEAEINARVNAETQAKWMGAIKNNPELTQSIETAPPEIQKSYNKVQKGTGGLKDNAVIASYLDGVLMDKQRKAQAEAAVISNAAKLAQTDYNRQLIEQSKSVIQSNQALADYRRAQAITELTGEPEDAQRGDLVAAIAGTPSPVAQRRTPAAPPVSAMDFNVPGSIAGIETKRVAPTPAIPAPLLQQPATAPTPAPAPAPTPEPGAAQFRDSEGNLVPMTTQDLSDPEVVDLVQKGLPTEDAVRAVEGKKELNAAKSKFIYGGGNTRGLPTASQYQSNLISAGVTLDDARKQTDLAIESGQVYVEPSSEELRKKEKEFNDTWRSDAAALSTIIGSSSEMSNTARLIYEEADWSTTGPLGVLGAFTGLGAPFTGSSGRELSKLVNQLKADAALTTIGELKSTAKTGATGLGQVSVVEFTSLIDKKNSIDQLGGAKKLIASTKRYMYNRNKAAYNAYNRMVEKFGVNAVNSLKGVSDKQMASILRDINEYEMENPEGATIAQRDGYYIERVGRPRHSTAPNPRPNPTGTPAPTPEEEADLELRRKAEFMGRQANREMDKVLSEASPRIPGFGGTGIPGVPSLSPNLGTVAPILRFFNVIPDATDAARVEQTYQSLKDDIEIK